MYYELSKAQKTKARVYNDKGGSRWIEVMAD
jgi:hypothetical protein